MHLLQTKNTYAETKPMSKQILIDIAKTNLAFSVILLRYFNSVGAHQSGVIGDTSQWILNNLMPYNQVSNGEIKKLRVFGNVYPAVNGTGP